MKDKKFNELYNQVAKKMAYHCYRNTFIEDIHAGKCPKTKTGDFSDVKVIDGNSTEIPWNELSRISDEEMCKLNKEVVNKIYTFLIHMDDKEAQYLFSRNNLSDWDDAQFDEGFMKTFALLKYPNEKE